MFNSALELKVQRKRIPLLGLAFTVQLIEAISPWATPYTIFWSAPQTGLSAIIIWMNLPFIWIVCTKEFLCWHMLMAYIKEETSWKHMRKFTHPFYFLRDSRAACSQGWYNIVKGKKIGQEKEQKRKWAIALMKRLGNEVLCSLKITKDDQFFSTMMKACRNPVLSWSCSAMLGEVVMHTFFKSKAKRRKLRKGLLLLLLFSAWPLK